MVSLRILLRHGVVAAALMAAPCAASAKPIGQWVDGNIDQLHNALAAGNYMDLQMHNFAELEKWRQHFTSIMPRAGDGTAVLPNFYLGFAQFVQLIPDERMDAAIATMDAHLAAYRAEFPRSPAPYIGRAQMLYERAWKARGSGYRSEVFKADFELYVKTLEEALTYLQSHESIASADPEYYRLLGEIEFQLTGDHSILFQRTKEGLAKFPGYLYPLWNLATYMSAHWGVTEERYEAWVELAIQASRDSDGTGMLARIYWSSRGGPRRYADIANGASEWPRIKQAFADELKNFPHAVNAARYLYVACKAKDLTVADELLGKLRLDPASGALFNFSADDYCARQE
jgi:hypothetical protein